MSKSGTKKCNQAYEILRKQLIYCQLPPNTRLTETQWAETLNVHRPALREALALLAHEGLLKRGKRGGYFTMDYTDEDRRRIIQVRAILEIGAIKACQENPPSAQQLKQLHETCELLEQVIEARLEWSIQEVDRKFHECLIRLCGNTRLESVYEQAPLPMGSLGEFTAEVLAVAKRTLCEHRKIVELITQGKYSKAVETLEKHLQTKYATHDRNQQI